ncbi:MAG TPA: TRAP transporter small permease subunit [Pseudolabrys sp.]|nr:TRAP transporter small permease subunit [Pseudolabrys sp.]
MIAFLDRMASATIAAMRWLALPLVLLLFLQWPLRDLVHGFSREANDLGQVVFALFVAVSVTAATRAGTHLAADAIAQRYSLASRRRIRQAGALLGLAPWALFILWSSRSAVLSSLSLFERFPDTANPGYFLIKLALWLMAALVLIQAIVDIARPLNEDDV